MNRSYQHPHAEPEHSFASGCRGKQAFTSRHLARGVLRVMLKRASTGHSLNVYKCRDCHHWHLGNKARRQTPVVES